MKQYRVAQIATSLHPGCEKMEREWESEEEKERVWGSGEEMERKWGNEERMRKWWENEEMEIYSLFTFRHFLFISPLYSFPISKIVTFCRKLFNTALLSRMSQKNLTYALWENNSGSNSLPGNSASCAGLSLLITPFFSISFYFAVRGVQIWHGTPLHQLILGVL